MANQFLTYWTPDAAASELSERDPIVTHAASAQLTRVRPGDVLWIVTAWPGGRMALLGRLPVGIVTDRAGAAALLGTEDLYEAPLHAVARDGAAEPMRNLDLSVVAADLRFESANDRLRVSEDGRVIPMQLQAMRHLTPASAELLEAVWRRTPESEAPDGEPVADEDTWYTEDEYRAALIGAESRISPLQRRMLAAHAEAPDCVLSVRQLAAAAGYDKPQVTYAQYGRLGYRLAEVLGHPHQETVWTRLLGRDWRTQDGSLVWEMHPELAHALVALGWASRAGAPDVVADLTAIAAAQDEADGDGSATTRDALVAARVGQGPFRAALLRYWGACAVTGISEPAVLRASHIKPWRDASDAERLDRYNGLLLAAHLDALFDAGLVTFDPEGWMVVSPLLAPDDRPDAARGRGRHATAGRRAGARGLPGASPHRGVPYGLAALTSNDALKLSSMHGRSAPPPPASRGRRVPLGRLAA